MPQHCIYWRLLFTKAHDRSSDPCEKSHPLLILLQVSRAWRTFIKEPQHGATARPFFLLPFFFFLGHLPPQSPWGLGGQSKGGGCGGLPRSLRELLSVSEWSPRMPLSAASFCRSLSRQAQWGGVGWGCSSGCGPPGF